MRRFRWTTGVGMLMVAASLVFAVAAQADPQPHGLGGQKGCASPTKIGDPVFCSYTIWNNSDGNADTMRAYFVEDTMLAAGGNVLSGNIFSDLAWEVQLGTATCWADDGLTNPANLHTIPAAGSGTAADPYTGANYCDISAPARIRSANYSFYDAQPGDFNLPDNRLGDRAQYLALDLCDGPGTGDCPIVPLENVQSASTLIVKRGALVDTYVHTGTDHANGLDPTSAANPRTIALGETVHDFVEVTDDDGGAAPTGNVQIEWYTNTTCSGNPAATSAPIALSGGSVDATSFTQTPTAAGGGFLVRYLGSGTHEPAVGVCEPVNVIAASLSLVKRTNGTDNNCPTGPTLTLGSTVTWTYEVTNTGNVTLTNIVVVDDNGTPANTADDVTIGTIASLAAGASTTLTRTGTATAGQYVNVATASTTFTSGAITIPVSDTDDDCYVGEQPPAVGSFTPGYWKNHRAHTTSLLPIMLGNYAVNTFDRAKDVFGGMNCGNSKPQSAIGCLAGHLLAAKLNVANGGGTCIAPVIANANTFLSGGTVSGVPGIVYTGPTGSYTLSAAQRTLAVAMKDALDRYNNDKGC